MNALTEGYLAWGLTKDKHAELEAELSDHLYCLQGHEGAGVASAAKARINSAAGRRKLAGPHLAEQVAGTLNRRPTRQEWRELCVLLLWFTLIILSDLLVLKIEEVARQQYYAAGYYNPTLNQMVAPEHARYLALAWLAQAVGRAGFFASFAACLVNAWRMGRGVCLARILQLKLIHTVLVVGSLLWMGTRLWDYWFDAESMTWPAPVWLTAPFILLAGVLLAALILILSRSRGWVWALGCVLAAGFLYCGGPVPSLGELRTHPMAFEEVVDAKGETKRVPSTDRHKIFQAALKRSRIGGVISVDVDSNESTFWVYRPAQLTYHVLGRDWLWYDRTPSYTAVLKGPPQGWHVRGITTPVVAAGGGLGWLALPIPILGVIGLTGMAFVMGRRSRGDAALYWTLCLVAIFSTILPFLFVGSNYSSELKMFDFGPTGVLRTPTPGFENLLIGSDMSDPWLIIFGLLLSAGVPWLVAGLFLRPRKSGLPSKGVEAE